MSLLGEESVLVQHYSTTRVNGRSTRVASGAAFALVASVQPMGEMAKDLPELARSSAKWIMIVENDPDLRVTNIAAQTSADRVTRSGGELYQIEMILDWHVHTSGLPHKVATLLEVGADERQG